ncbi:adenosylcobinamide amidohydrolase [Actinocorallia sp. B10E7]|uniref:adenosylcobinamide amidohydrolase n=1 Tax=Actinocorallia sp. B10E7 TaxID=3153558 RepID=UPI00325F5BF6
MRIETVWRAEEDAELPALVWRPGPRRMISSGLLGGGIGPAGWVLNAQVPGDYSRMDPLVHLRELAARFGLDGPGVGLLTAAEIRAFRQGRDGGVSATATVGLRVPTWAASPEGRPDPVLAPTVPEQFRPGTINIVVSVPVALDDAALVNAVLTATEAKTQALLEAGYDCSGTASDAVCVAAAPHGRPEPFAGPRSVWGSRIARAVHAAVLEGSHDYTRRLAGGPSSP